MCYSPKMFELNSLLFIEYFSNYFTNTPKISMYCVFGEMRCVKILDLLTTFGDLPAFL